MSIAVAFTHLIEGYDIPIPGSMVKMRGERAARKLDSLPYSFLTNLHHTVVWQEQWLRGLRGEPRRSGPEIFALNWRVPEVKEWEELRKQFVDGLLEARALAETRTDPKDVDLLCRILVHASYHVGQMFLLKRAIYE